MSNKHKIIYDDAFGHPGIDSCELCDISSNHSDWEKPCRGKTEKVILNTSQFLPCPFCGSTKIEVFYDDGYNVGCKDCSTYVAPFLGTEADDKQKHIDFWNTRAKINPV